MEDRIAEADYCGFYKTGLPYHWVVVWEEFLPWFEKIGKKKISFPTDDWRTRTEVVAVFFARVYVKHALPEVAACKVKVGLCTQKPAHLHVLLESVVLKEEVSNG